MEDFFKIGIITATHGLHGEVKVFPTTDDVRRFKKLKQEGVTGLGRRPRRSFSGPGDRERKVLQAVCHIKVKRNR